MNGKADKWVKVKLWSSLLLMSIGTLGCKLYQPVVANEISIEAQVEYTAIVNDPQPIPAPNSQVEDELLERTVQIKMYSPLPAEEPMSKPESDPQQYLVTHGLGSLVVWQGKYVVVTHNHWGDGLNQAEYVQIYDWQDKLLRTMGKDKFMSLILYSDPGTLVIYDPTATWVSAGHLGDEQSVVAGDIVTIAHQDLVNPGKVDLMQAEVVGLQNSDGLTVLGVVVMDNGKIIGGDSGGGVWMDGELIGNTWAVEKSAGQTVSSGSGLIALLPEITFENQDDVAEIPGAPLYNSSDPIMY